MTRPVISRRCTCGCYHLGSNPDAPPPRSRNGKLHYPDRPCEVPPPPPRPLACPYCGKADLTVDMEWQGLPYVQDHVAVGLTCGSCDADWTITGDPINPARWIRWPSLYDRPEGAPA